MTVLELKLLLDDAPDDMIVYLMSRGDMGGFVFEEACPNSSGIAEFGNDAEYYGSAKAFDPGFVLIPYNMGQNAEDHDLNILN